MEKILSTWAGLASHYVGELFDEAGPFIDKDSKYLDRYLRFVNTQLFIDCHLSSESVLLLIKSGKEWDADMIIRSVMEGTVKYIYLMTGADEEMKEKAREYWEIMPEIAELKRNERLKAFLAILDDPDSPAWIPYQQLLLPDDVIAQINAKYEKKTRDQLIRKWSFSQITKYFLDSDSERLRHLVHLAHGYGTSSHLIHKDGDGVGMVWERYGRDSTRQTAVKLGHSSRIVSDVCVFAELRLLYLLKASKQTPNIIVTVQKKHTVLFGELQKARDNFIAKEYGQSQK